MAKKSQSSRLTRQHKKSRGVAGIFGRRAKSHDMAVSAISRLVVEQLEGDYSGLTFRYRASLTKEEINAALRRIDQSLGQTLFVPNSRIKPDGGIVEVRDDKGNWRVILVSEAKYQGRDIENIKSNCLDTRCFCAKMPFLHLPLPKFSHVALLHIENFSFGRHKNAYFIPKNRST